MRKIQKTTIGLALFALLAFGGVSAAAKGSAASQRTISGVVTRIDFRTRTAEVRELSSGRIIEVQIPEGMTVKTNLTMSRSLRLEQLLPGMHITANVQ
jgi:multidrug efflux pump subunit AcrA (membrane-fusion protein)